MNIGPSIPIRQRFRAVGWAAGPRSDGVQVGRAVDLTVLYDVAHPTIHPRRLGRSLLFGFTASARRVVNRHGRTFGTFGPVPVLPSARDCSLGRGQAEIKVAGDRTPLRMLDWTRFRGGRQAVMHAAVGDRIIVASATLGTPARDGEILEVHGTNGEAPYLVRWSDTGRESLFFPGPDVHMQHYEAPQSQAEAARPAAQGSDQPSRSASHVRNWHIDLYLSEGDESSAAHAVLHGATPTTLDSRGAARHKAGEANVPEIGDEVAVARALRALADRLLATASEDMSAIEGRAVHIEP
jgi:hypothetical protein